MDPWEGGSEYPGSIDGSPRLLDTGHPACQSDLRFTRHKATWINPQCVQQPLQDLPLQMPTVGNSGSYFVGDGASPLGPSPLSLEYSLVETVLSKDTVGSMGSSGGKSNSFSFTATQERTVLPGCSPWMSVFTRSKILATSPHSEADSACFTPSHLPVSTGEGNFSRGLPSFLSVHTFALSVFKGLKPVLLSSS